MNPSTAPLSPSHRKLLRRGIACFNREEFFECHEILEEAWREASFCHKKFLQGLIQIAVAFHHLRKNNIAGTKRLLSEGLAKLIPFAPRYEGVNISAFAELLEAVKIAVNSDNGAQDMSLPKISFQFATDFE